jgi:putative ATPase
LQDLFSSAGGSEPPPSRPPAGRRGHAVPLAERMRPRSLAEFRGQQHLVGPGGALRDMLDSGALSSSLLFWGPPGSGKTTLARLLAQHLHADFVGFSAVTAGVKEVKEVVERARALRRAGGRGVLLFVDEVHRFNKAQQDAFLPHIEDGTLTLVGATTENPSFAINAALRSRSRVFELQPLAAGDIEAILRDAIADRERGLGHLDVGIETGVLHHLAVWADGDARTALNALEFAAAGARPGRRFEITSERLRAALARRQLGLDRGGEEHYNLISALHKSLRGSDPDASLYWLARLLEAGEDPLYVARRLMRVASEDVGNADPRALGLAVAAAQVVSLVGMPEADLALAQAVLYLATAPKSNAVTRAYEAARQDVREDANPPVPLHLRNAPTPLMRELGRGAGYLYPHDFERGIVVQDYLPEALQERIYYTPSAEGYERTLADRLEAWRAFRESLRRSGQVGRARGGREGGQASSQWEAGPGAGGEPPEPPIR